MVGGILTFLLLFGRRGLKKITFHFSDAAPAEEVCMLSPHIKEELGRRTESVSQQATHTNSKLFLFHSWQDNEFASSTRQVSFSDPGAVQMLERYN